MTVSEYIYDFLAKKGVESAFMVSGSSAMWLTDALKRETRYRVICNHHEQACAMSADIYGRLTGKPAVCLVTVGPGATNAITGVAGAYLDSIPMIVLSGQASTGMLKIAEKHNLRQQGTQSILLADMVSPVTKYFAQVMDEKSIKFHMEKAFHVATTGRPGPVWLDVPVDIQNKQIPDNMDSAGFDNCDAPEFKFDTLCQWLKNSKRPLILAGHGVRISGAAENLVDFAEKYRIPIITSRLGIDLINSDNDLFVGRPGAYGDRASHYAIQTCDLLLSIGARMAVSCIGYNGGAIAKNAKKVLVEIDKYEIDKGYVPIDEVFNMDAKQFLHSLNAELLRANVKIESDNWVRRCYNLREKYKVLSSEHKVGDKLNSYYVIDEISRKASDDCAVVVDTGSVCNITSQTWRVKGTQRYLISGGLSSMGYWAGVIGAGHLFKGTGKYAVAITGDGSFQMNIQEMATIKYNNLPVKVFVINNDGYLLIRLNQHNYMNDRFLGVGPDSGVGMPDFAAVATAYGLKSIHIKNPNELDGKLNEVFACNDPVICIIDTMQFQDITPRMASKVMPDGSLKASDYEDLFPFLPDDEHKENMEIND